MPKLDYTSCLNDGLAPSTWQSSAKRRVNVRISDILLLSLLILLLLPLLLLLLYKREELRNEDLPRNVSLIFAFRRDSLVKLLVTRVQLLDSIYDVNALFADGKH